MALFVGGIVGPALLGLGGTLFAKDPVIQSNFVIFSICLGVAVELLGLLLGIFSWRRKAGKVVVIGVPTLALLGLGLVLLMTHYRSHDMASRRAEREKAVRRSIDHNRRLSTQPSDAKPPG